MIERPHFLFSATRATTLATLLAAAALGGCAGLADGPASSAFVDPAKYELWECPALEGERKSLASQIAGVEKLIAKAETGAAGPVVAELAYRNSYISLRAQAKLADEAWLRNRCDHHAPMASQPAPPPVGARAPLRSGGAVH